MMAAAIGTALVLGGCGVTGTSNVDIKKGTVKSTSTSYYSATELAVMKATGSSPKVTKTMKCKGTKYYGEVSKSSSKGAKQLAKGNMFLDKDKFISYCNISDYTPAEYRKLLKGLEFIDYKCTFNVKPKSSNGKISGKTVRYTKIKDLVFYATFTKAASKCKKVTPTVAPGKTGEKTVQFKTRGVVTKIKVNGEEYYGNPKYKNGKLLCDYVTFESPGVYKVQVQLAGGYKKSFEYEFAGEGEQVSQ